jgi:hypothetical protein
MHGFASESIQGLAWQHEALQMHLIGALVSFRQLMLWHGKQCIEKFSTSLDVRFSTTFDEKFWVQIFCNLGLV